MSKISNKFLAQMAAHTYKGNNTSSTANPLDVTSTQLTADLNLFTSGLQGLVPASGGGTTNFLRADGTWAAAGSGSVTSVALADSTGLFNITGSPVTSTGTLTLSTFQSKTANTFFAAPNGAAGAPTFRSIVGADVPTLNQNTTGSAASISGTNVITNSNLSQMPTLTIKGNNTGATANAADLTVAQVNAILPIFTSALNGLTPLSGGGTTNFLRADGTWANPPGSFTNPMTTLGDIIYENATPAPARLAGNITSTKNFLTQTGTGAVSAAPSWGVLTSGDIPNNAANTTGTASNITATTNSTLTTLSALSLPGGQVTGNISGNAANVTGTVVVSNGGTGNTSFPVYALIAGGTTSTGNLQSVSGLGTSGQILTSNGAGALPTWQAAPGTVSAFFASSIVNTSSTGISSTSFTTFSNSPAFTFSPSISGTYKVYSPAQLFQSVTATFGAARVFNTTGAATLLQESIAQSYSSSTSIAETFFVQSVYTLTAGTSYVFDLQGKTSGGGNITIDTTLSPFYMFAELVVSGASTTVNVTTITANTTLTSANNIVLVNGAGAVAVTLPAGASGLQLTIKNISAFTTTITPASGTIDGSASITLPVQNTSVSIVSNGTNWFVI